MLLDFFVSVGSRLILKKDWCSVLIRGLWISNDLTFSSLAFIAGCDAFQFVRGDETMKKVNAFKFCLAVLVLVLPVEDSNAQSTVLYCQETETISLDKNGLEQYQEKRFKLNITSSGITFGSDFGFLPNVSISFTGPLKIGDYSGPDNWWVAGTTDHISYTNGFLLILQNYGQQALAVAAQCDAF